MRQNTKKRMRTSPVASLSLPFDQGYDPELLIVECARCGQPVLWERGRSTEMLAVVGVDPLELDAHCLLLTDGCPRCSPRNRDKFSVQVFRVASGEGKFFGLRTAGTA